MSTRKAIRITLRLGIRTDEQLWQELEACRPYARAKHVRRLMADGLRWRTRATTVVERVSQVSLPVQQAFGPENTPNSKQSLEEDIWRWQQTSTSIRY